MNKLTCLREAIYPTNYNGGMWPPVWFLRKPMARFGVRAYKNVPRSSFEHGKVWPLGGYTMIGTKRLDALQASIEEVERNNVPGVFVECGVWRGGALIWMYACCDGRREVYGFDSFRGLMRSSEKDTPDTLWRQTELSVSQEEVQRNLETFGAKATLVRGWVQDTVPQFKQPIAVLRIDVDHYYATQTCLKHLWPLVSPGGHVHLDDYDSISGAKKAIEEYRSTANPIESRIDSEALLWLKHKAR